jgi:elongation factor G
MDWMEQEQERGITITSAATTCFWNDHQINIIDTPGHVDFTVEVERSLRVLDGAVAVFDGKEGVEPQSEQVWRQATKYDVPAHLLRQQDGQARRGLLLHRAHDLRAARRRPLPIQLPIGSESAFEGVIDLVEMRALTWRGEVKKGEDYGIEEIPAELLEQAQSTAQQLIEAVAEADDELMEIYLAGDELTPRADQGRHPQAHDRLRGLPGAVRLRVQEQGRAADARRGHRLPAVAVGRADVEGTLPDGEHTTAPQAQRGRAVLGARLQDRRAPVLRQADLRPGVLRQGAPGAQVINSTKERKERIGKLFQMHANKENPVDEARAGHIYACIGLKETTTGDTLCDPGRTRSCSSR